MESDLDVDRGIDRGFWNDIRGFSKKLSAKDDFLVVTHHDADGITACAITVDLLRHLGKSVDYMGIKQLDSNTIGKIKSFGERTIVFTDMGSGQLGLLAEEDMKGYYVIDHHPPDGRYELQINPHPYGYDGGLDISGAGMAYLVAKSLGREDMAHLAVVGSVGDMQDSNGKLHSINRLILNDAVEQGTVEIENDLRLFGRQSRTLPQMLAYSSEPFLPGLSGNQSACAQFIQSNGIGLQNPDGSFRSYVELTHLERKELATALYIHLLDNNTPEFIIQMMVGEVYTLIKEREKTELRDAKEFSTVLNACGRQKNPEIGIEVCLGDRGEKWENAKRLLVKHREALKRGLEYLSSVGVKTMDSLYYFDADESINESIIGVIAGMAYGARIIPPDKPVLSFAQDEDSRDMLKVSARATWELVRKGIHLGDVMRDCSKIFGGEGGGHDIAAGARILKDKKEDFLKKVDDTFDRQLSGTHI